MEARDPEYLRDLVRELCALPAETEWVEFKRNNADPETIGKNISALANGAALHSREAAYIVWGVDDRTHTVVGTDFVPDVAKKGNELLKSWLNRMVSDATFEFQRTEVDGMETILLEIAPASQFPARFRRDAYIRVGSVTKSLSDHRQIERRLWRLLDARNFEDGIAATHHSDEAVMTLLDCPAYFQLLGIPLPDGNANILDAIRKDGLIRRSDAGSWNITNLGAILIARDLSAFTKIQRKRLRIIRYDGIGRFKTERELEIDSGYALAFQSVIEQIMTLTPSNEVIEQALNVNMPMFPEIAVRELVANALIHQDFLATGTGPMVEIFGDRIEITNSGKPLVETLRFLDAPPKSRNELFASMMRRFGICEERGSGIDKVIDMIEVHQLPAPVFETVEEFTRCVLFAHKKLSDMSRDERVLACYWHASLRFLLGQSTNNQSIRERFDIPSQRSDHASRLLKEAVEADMLVIENPAVGNKSRTYLPNWAAPSSSV